MSELKLSEKIAEYDGGSYWITAAIWRTNIQGSYFDTFEIGIREKNSGKFTLLQSEKYNHQTVQEVANTIAHILNMQGECYTPEWCQRFLT